MSWHTSTFGLDASSLIRLLLPPSKSAYTLPSCRGCERTVGSSGSTSECQTIGVLWMANSSSRVRSGWHSLSLLVAAAGDAPSSVDNPDENMFVPKKTVRMCDQLGEWSPEHWLKCRWRCAPFMRDHRTGAHVQPEVEARYRIEHIMMRSWACDQVQQNARRFSLLRGQCRWNKIRRH